MSKPFFSVIIPALNEQKTLPILLSNLEKQTFTHFEVWVVDGSSTDKTATVVETMAAKDQRFHLLTTTIRNPGHQRNLGAKESIGKYLLFFDADNQLPADYLADLHQHCVQDSIEAFTTFSKSDISSLKYTMYIKVINAVFEQSTKVGLPIAFGSCIGCLHTLFMKLGGFDEQLQFGEDTEFVRRLARKKFHFVVLRQPQYMYSMRRFRKEGTLKLIQKVGPHTVRLLFKGKGTTSFESYPMGGHYFEEESKR